MPSFFNSAYNNFLYPLKKILFRESVHQTNRIYWEKLGREENAVATKNFRAYRDEVIKQHWDVMKIHISRAKIAVMDIGCGRGDALKGYEKTIEGRFRKGIGFDISEPAIEMARKSFPQFEFHVCDITNPTYELPPEARHSADLLYAHSMLHYVPEKDLDFFFDRCRELLSPEGVILVVWWAPYYFDETWAIPFAPGSHRHRKMTVLKSFARHFELIELPALEPKAPAQDGGRPALRIFRSLFQSLHPKETGIVFGHPRRSFD